MRFSNSLLFLSNNNKFRVKSNKRTYITVKLHRWLKKISKNQCQTRRNHSSLQRKKKKKKKTQTLEEKWYWGDSDITGNTQINSQQATGDSHRIDQDHKTDNTKASSSSVHWQLANTVIKMQHQTAHSKSTNKRN
jgi:hypothetical protein